MKMSVPRKKDVPLKRGDQVLVYHTVRFQYEGTSSFSTAPYRGWVRREYRHIRAVVIQFTSGTRFIREDDPEWSVSKW